MTDSQRRGGFDLEVKPDAYDPIAHPELFNGVLTRRAIAFLIDIVIIAVPVLIAGLFIFLFGIFTLGVGFLLYWLLSPAAVVWAVFYYGMTMGGPASATLGMRAVDIEVRTRYGAPCYFLLGAVHAVAFWISISAITPLVLVIGFFNVRRRLLHDFLVGVVVINSAPRGFER